MEQTYLIAAGIAGSSVISFIIGLKQGEIRAIRSLMMKEQQERMTRMWTNMIKMTKEDKHEFFTTD